MRYAYIFLSEAQEEYESALDWYLLRSIKAAEGFTLAMDDALKLICAYPKRWRNEYAEYYELSIKKYPFTIIYFIDNDHQLVVVSSIYHHSRNPENKYRK